MHTITIQCQTKRSPSEIYHLTDQEQPDSEKYMKKTRSKLKILVVEDGVLNQKVTRLMLEHLGYRADIAENGEQALAMYTNGYAAILMDIGLPDMDGLEVCSIIRQREADTDRRIPIIAVTAYDCLVREECMSVGMDGFTTKPIFMDDLDAVLKKILRVHSLVRSKTNSV